MNRYTEERNQGNSEKTLRVISEAVEFSKMLPKKNYVESLDIIVRMMID